MGGTFAVLWVSLLLVVIAQGRLRTRRIRRQAISSRKDLWPDGIIPYEIRWGFYKDDFIAIRRAIAEWEAFTCVRFKEANNTTPMRLEISRYRHGCHSNIGTSFWSPVVNLGTSCMSHATVLHELGHALGLHHEHERPDRDKFVRVHMQNIPEEHEEHFTVKRRMRTFDLPYSYRSIMHYTKRDYATKGYLSMEAVNPRFTDVMGRSQHLSFRDVQLVNQMYDCADCRAEIRCPYGAFVGPNCRCWCPSIDYTAVDCETNRAIDSSRVADERGRLVVDPRHGETYYGSAEKADWFDAGRKCQSMGGWLIRVDRQSVTKRLYLVLKYVMNGKYSADNDIFWTSGNDMEKEGVFRWGNRKLIDFKQMNRARNEPNDGWGHNEDCVAVRVVPRVRNYFFYDRDCGRRMRYLCGLPHKGCYDRSPTCSYYSDIGQCEKYPRRCKRSCGECDKKRGGKKRKRRLQPAPPRPAAKRCRPLSCASMLTADLVANVSVGEELCVICPYCSCLRPIYGFRLYPGFARVCCAVLQMRGGSSEGLHVIRRMRGAHKFPSGRRHGVVSRWAGYSSSAFAVKGHEPILENARICIAFDCLRVPMRLNIFNRMLPGAKFCIQCPPCACADLTGVVFGSGTYHRRSSACCAAAHALGRHSGGLFFVRKVPGKNSYGASVRHGVRSSRTFAYDDWAFRVSLGPRTTKIRG